MFAALAARRVRRSVRAGGPAGAAPAIAWAAAAALESTHFSAPLAASNLVPALLFPALGALLPPVRSVAYGLVCAVWIAAPDVAGGALTFGTAAALVIACAGLAVGVSLRRALAASKSAEEEVRRAVDESRSLLLPWERIDTAVDRDPLESVEGHGLLRWRADVDDAVRRVIEGLGPIAGARLVCYAANAAAPGGHYRLVAPGGGGAAGADGLRIPDGYVPVREALIFRRAFFAEGEEAAAWDPGIPGAGGPLTGIAAVPVTCGGEVEGALVAFRYGEGRWAEPVTPALEMGAYFIGREIERSRSWYSAARYLAQREGLHRAIQHIATIAEQGGGGENSAPVRREVLRLVLEQVRGALALTRAILVVTDADGKKGRIGWECGPAGGREGAEWVDLGGTYLGWVSSARVHRMFSGVSAAPPRHPVVPAAWADAADDAYMLMPAGEIGDFRGVLVCAGGKGRAFHAGDAQCARDLVAVMRMGISHALHVESLREEATRDGLTGLYNRKTFQANLERATARLDGRHPCAVLMLDIDHFKRINDTYGHAAGDEVLRTVAGVIRKTIRKGDMAGRYGGEEFIVYLNLADEAQAFRGAERLRMMIRQTRFMFGGREVGVTASLGVAVYPRDGTHWEALVRKADGALYRSKSEGRDRTTVCGNRGAPGSGGPIAAY